MNPEHVGGSIGVLPQKTIERNRFIAGYFKDNFKNPWILV